MSSNSTFKSNCAICGKDLTGLTSFSNNGGITFFCSKLCASPPMPKSVNVEAFLDTDELAFLQAECQRMDREEPITNPWTVEAILETWLQMDLDKRRGLA